MTFKCSAQQQAYKSPSSGAVRYAFNFGDDHAELEDCQASDCSDSMLVRCYFCLISFVRSEEGFVILLPGLGSVGLTWRESTVQDNHRSD